MSTAVRLEFYAAKCAALEADATTHEDRLSGGLARSVAWSRVLDAWAALTDDDRAVASAVEFDLERAEAAPC